MKITSVRPWLIKSDASYWGEFLFVEVTTDEGVSGWGEITTTTRLANRALCTILRQIGAAVTGEDPARIEYLWHKIFRSFTYMVDLLEAPGLGLDIDAEGARKYLSEEDAGFFD